MSDSGQSDSNGGHFGRSRESLQFERMWRALPRKGLLPQRRAFQARLAKAFLRHLLLVQAPTAEDPTLRIRLVGDAIRGQILNNIVDQDFLDFLPEPERKVVVLDNARALFAQPSGVWWVAPVHYERGFSQYWELTAFPLAGGERTRAAILVLVRPFDVILDTRRTDQKAIRVDAPARIEFIAIDPLP